MVAVLGGMLTDGKDGNDGSDGNDGAGGRVKSPSGLGGSQGVYPGIGGGGTGSANNPNGSE